MSRDNSIFFMSTEFPHNHWATILLKFKADSWPIDDLDRRLSITHKWSFDGVDGGVHVDLKRIVAGRHLAPFLCNWAIGIHCNGHHGIHQWFLYAIPIFAIVRFDNTIFYDPQAGVAVCDVAGIEKRMCSVLPSLVDKDKLINHGYTTHDDPFWPCSLDRNSEVSASDETRRKCTAFVLNTNSNPPFRDAETADGENEIQDVLLRSRHGGD